MSLPANYEEKVYAGVLGKIIGVYLGRPFEGWSYERIMEELGEVWYYVHDRLGMPLIVTDDDISGTFTFVRALPDYGNSLSLTPQQIGQAWLNYLIEKKTILWWGGLGNSTEHTAYLRLKKGIPAPQSGSISINGPIVAQQIGAQIFIDGWAMVAPGDPQRAADLARRAASVSHDGEAIYGAQVLAAMEAQAFVEQDIDRLLDTGVSLIPKDSIIYRMIADLRNWHLADGDWRKTRERIVEHYGYKDFIGGCHMVPNHALIILGLLYGEGDFQKSLMICNTSGWDTDCNSGNLGCLMGIRNGLAGFEGAVDWRGPVADRLYIPTADGGRSITDAVIETYHLVNCGRALAGLPPVAAKGGARFHFELPGSLQGFLSESGEGLGQLQLANVAGHSRKGSRSLALRVDRLAAGQVARAATATFIPPDALNMPGYGLLAAPTLYSGQVLRAGLLVDEANRQAVIARLFVRYYDETDQPVILGGAQTTLTPGVAVELEWQVPDTSGAPIFQVGVEMASAGVLYLDYLGWSGTPEVTFARPAGVSPYSRGEPQAWRMAWVNAVEQWEPWGAAFRLIQNEGRGLLMTGTREWKDYRLSAQITPALVKAGGLAARVQGLRRFYALQLVEGGKARLIKALDSENITLAEAPFPWQLWKPYTLTLQVKGSRLQGWLEDRLLFDLEDHDQPLEDGGIALVIEEGHLMTDAVTVSQAA